MPPADDRVRLHLGALAYTWDGAPVYAESLAGDDVAFVYVVEHLRAREILPVPRTEGGTGSRLELTGEPEPYGWFVPSESSVLSTAPSAAVADRTPSGSSVLRGYDAVAQLDAGVSPGSSAPER